MINTEIANPTFYYSLYGYIEVDQNEVNNPDTITIPFIKRTNYLVGSINKNQLTDKIKINIKTFYGDRNQYSFTVNINERLNELIPKICEEEENLSKDKRELKKFHYANQFRMFSSMGYMRELNPLKTFREEGIKNDEIILLLDPTNVNFSETNKGNLIHLENKNKVAFKQGGDEHQFILTEQGFKMGKHYCEVILETEPYEKSIIVGVSIKRNDFHLNQADVKGFYGYILSECKKISNNNGKVEMIEYGDITKIGDRIGIMMEFNQTGLDITFYINKINMGVAFKNLPLNVVYYPAIVLGFDGARVRITNNVEFPDL